MKKLPWLFLLACFACNDEATPIPDVTVPVIIFDEGNENRTVSIEVTLTSAYDQPLDIAYRTNGMSAKPGVDFVEANSSFTIPAGSLSGTADIEFIGDEHLELTEVFQLILTHNGEEITYEIQIDDEDSYTPEKDADGFITPAVYPSMELVWSDEFDGTEIDGASWTHEIGNGCDKGICGWGNNELQVYTDAEANSFVKDGALTIVARDESEFTSARMISQDKQEFQFGRIDIRAKMPEGQGIWPAIWMLGTNIDEVGWPVCGEIDIMELVGHNPSTTHGTAHYDANGYASKTSSRNVQPPASLQDEYHVYSIIWEQNEIKWMLDYNQYNVLTQKMVGATYPFNQSFFFILNIAVGGNWPGDPDETTTFPQRMQVDYVRVFR